MADPTPATAVAAAPLPSPTDIARVEQFTRERFVHEGEDPVVALGPGTPRRHALDAALTELAEGLEHPSTEWRRAYSLLLGLERVLSEDEPHLADGTLLNPHQVDALSGTLTALLAASMIAPAATSNGNGNGNGNGRTAAPPPSPEDAFEGSPAVPGEEEIDEEVPDDEEPLDWDDSALEDDDAQLGEAPEDPNAHKRFWFEHATGAGKTVAAMGFVEASRTGGVLILTHRRNLVDQFIDELRTRGYIDRLQKPLMQGDPDRGNGPVTVETYQWFVRNAGSISSAYTVVICDEAHTALGEKTSEAIREWTGPIFVGMTATGALIARHVTDLFPTQTSRFDLAQAARRGVIAPLRCIRIPPGTGVRSIAKVPLRRGEVDVEFDQEMLAELLDQLPFNLAVANLYKTRFNNVPGVVYAAGVRHAYNVAEAFREEGLKAMAVSGETPKRELADILARYERGDIDVLVNAQLLAEGWNSPRATVCLHLAPTASKRIYQQRVGRVTRRHPGKESGVVVDFVHPATKHDDPVVTLHSLLDRDVYRGGAIVVGPVRRGRGRRVRVERRVLPVTADEERRAQVFERELWRIAVEHLDWGEQHVWAALAGARVQPSGWRRARAMLHFDKSGELKRRFLLTAVQRNKSAQLRVRALQEIAQAKDAEAFDLAIDEIGGWARDERREAVKVCLQALAEKRIGRRDQANAWIWRLAEYSRDVHEEYAVQRWPETKRLLGLLVNSSGGAHARNARRLVHATRKQDRRLSAALLAAALAHTPEAEEVLRGARTRMARKPNSLARDLLRNFPKKRSSRGSRRKKRTGEETATEPVELLETTDVELLDDDGDETELDIDTVELDDEPERAPTPALDEAAAIEAIGAAAALLHRSTPLVDPDGESFDDAPAAEEAPAKPKRSRRRKPVEVPAQETPAVAAEVEAPAAPKRTRRKQVEEPAVAAEASTEPVAEEAAKPRRTRKKPADPETNVVAQAELFPAAEAEVEAPAKPKRSPRRKSAVAAEEAPAAEAAIVEEKPKRTRTTRAKAAAPAEAEPTAETLPAPTDAGPVAAPAADAEPVVAEKPKRTRTTRAKATEPVADAEPVAEEKPKRTRATRAKAAAPAEAVVAPADAEPVAEEKPKRTRTTRAKAAAPAEAPEAVVAPTDAEPVVEEKPKRTRTTRAKAAPAAEAEPVAEEKPKRTRTTRAKAAPAAEAEPVAEEKPKRTRTTRAQAAPAEAEPAAEAVAEEKPERTRTTRAKAAAAAEQTPAGDEPPKPRRTRRKPADDDSPAEAA